VSLFLLLAAHYARHLKTLAARWNCGGSAPLSELDDRTLADIGIDRSEIGSIEAEGLGRSGLTRRRIVWSWPHA
jgi:hypothetical protein